MANFETTSLWKDSFGLRSGVRSEQLQRKKLRDAFLGFRERAAILAGEIQRDLPHLTVHDVTHLDALWESASLIAGVDYPVTPTEAFVLGGAFLVHDLAMSTAAYSDESSELYNDPAWMDIVFLLLKKKLGRIPVKKELKTPGSDVEEQATRELIRLRHAKKAEKLPNAVWRSGKQGEPYFLIEDAELRETYGPTIGRIAHSHWWSVDALRDEFLEPLGAPGLYPYEWIVDTLKVAALLRVADASHLDERRARSFLLAIRKPQGISEAHWRFQNLLLRPRLENDSLVFTSKRPFSIQEAPAWWVCFDALRVVDSELRHVDALLADTKRRRFTARRVAKVGTPLQLAECLRTEGWSPIDTQLRVTDVASLAFSLGGTQLYGKDKTVPLRELIQNSSDAVRARRLAQDKPTNWGDIYVRLGSDETGHWLEVRDNGLGMSTEVLSGPLLNFGSTYWGSELMLSEHPGLLSKGLRPSGKYGIGFFAVFMLGERVRVTTRRYRDAHSDTQVLEFGEGLYSRPILRKATDSEMLTEAGTAVRVWLKVPADSPFGFLSHWGWNNPPSINLKRLCMWLCPSIDVNLHVQIEPGNYETAVGAYQWEQMTGEELFLRLEPEKLFRSADFKYSESFLRKFKKELTNLRELRDSSGEIVGRACLSIAKPQRDQLVPGVITSGGFRANPVRFIFGILIGTPITASRIAAMPVVSDGELARWASEQAELVSKLTNSPAQLAQFAAIIRSCGGNTKDLPIMFDAKGWQSIRDVQDWKTIPNEVIFVPAHRARHLLRHKTIKLNDGVFGISDQPTWADALWVDWPKRSFVYYDGNGHTKDDLKVAVIEVLARKWAATLEDVFRASTTHTNVVIGSRGKLAVECEADVFRKPKVR